VKFKGIKNIRDVSALFKHGL